ncbi:hypothetical protein [Planktotalea sp.]|uniref:hypothetical protein n=1 Tax=Planktotalea sp. TaxID=2029877 RepID=UPI003D6A0939
MIPFWLRFAIGLCLWGQAALSETIVVRTAQHADFTRIVLDMKQPETASVSMKKTSLIVNLPKTTKEIDASDFFRRISRDQLSSIRLDQQFREIEIALNCRCEYKSYIAGTNMFAIDVFRPSADDTVRPRSTWRASDRGSRSQLTFGNLVETKGASVGEVAPKVPHSRETLKGPSVPLLSTISKGENSSQLRLLSRLDIEKDAPPSAGGQHMLSPKGLSNNVTQMRLHPSPSLADRESYEVESAAATQVRECAELDEINPLNWNKEDEALKILKTARRKVATDANEFDDLAARTLARNYLALAMGAEAGALLATISQPTSNDHILKLLSKFIDGEQNKELVSEFSRLSHCPGALLWSLLVGHKQGDELSELGALGEQQIVDLRLQFEQWPRALQGVFVADWAEILLRAGATDAASFSLRRTEDGFESETGQRSVVAAKIARETSGVSSAMEILEVAIENDSDQAPQAAVALAEMALEDDAPLEGTQKEALIAYSEELKGTTLEPELLRARIRTAVQEQDFATAIALTDEYKNHVRSSQVDVVVDEIGIAISEIESNAVFLTEAVSYPSGYFERSANEVKDKIQNRIIELGFADLARQLGTASQSKLSASRPENDLNEKVGAQKETPVSIQDETITNALESAPSQPRSPVAQAVRNTEDLLESLTSFKAELSQLGLE